MELVPVRNVDQDRLEQPIGGQKCESFVNEKPKADRACVSQFRAKAGKAGDFRLGRKFVEAQLNAETLNGEPCVLGMCLE